MGYMSALWFKESFFIGYMSSLCDVAASAMDFDAKVIKMICLAASAICLVFCFVKMDIDPWAAIIPIYGYCCLCKQIWGHAWLGFIWLAAIILAIFGSPFALILAVIADILEIVTYFRMFKGFGKSTLFCIFGIIFQPIAIAICAFDGSEFSC